LRGQEGHMVRKKLNHVAWCQTKGATLSRVLRDKTGLFLFPETVLSRLRLWPPFQFTTFPTSLLTKQLSCAVHGGRAAPVVVLWHVFYWRPHTFPRQKNSFIAKNAGTVHLFRIAPAGTALAEGEAWHGCRLRTTKAALVHWTALCSR
jgi:hypothetical protein